MNIDRKKYQPIKWVNIKRIDSKKKRKKPQKKCQKLWGEGRIQKERKKERRKGRGNVWVEKKIIKENNK